MNKAITIHHYDDEPQSVSSLRDNLLYKLMLDHPSWIRDEEVPPDNAHPFTIKIHRPEALVRINYFIYNTAVEFLTKAHLAETDIAILDVVERGKDGAPLFKGADCANKAREILPVDRIFFLSAYVQSLPEDLRRLIPREQFKVKPFNVNSFTIELLSKMGLN
jgi:hypothetical protein